MTSMPMNCQPLRPARPKPSTASCGQHGTVKSNQGCGMPNAPGRIPRHAKIAKLFVPSLAG